jgi:hypothetical protein
MILAGQLVKRSNVLIGCGVLAGFVLASSALYKTAKIYLLRRKYRHLPGPETKGYYSIHLSYLITLAAYTFNALF